MSDHTLILIIISANVINAVGSTVRTVFAIEKRRAARNTVRLHDHGGFLKVAP